MIHTLKVFKRRTERPELVFGTFKGTWTVGCGMNQAHPFVNTSNLDYHPIILVSQAHNVTIFTSHDGDSLFPRILLLR